MGRRRRGQDGQGFVPAPQENLKWINTPFAYAQLCRGMTLLQQDVLLQVSSKLQHYMAQFFKSGRQMLDDNPNSLFSPADTRRLPPVEIKIQEFGLEPYRYEEIRSAAYQTASIRIAVPLDYATERCLPVFDEVVIPKEPSTHTDNSGKVWHLQPGTIYAFINPKVSCYAFNMRLGYVKHPLTIASDAAHSYSPSIYFMLKHYLGRKSKSVTLPYDEVREKLGMKELDPETGDWKKDADGKTIETYPQFSRFKKRVLDPAVDDIDRLAGLGILDLTFSYEAIYSSGDTRKQRPDAIRFDVFPAKLVRLSLSAAEDESKAIPATPEPALPAPQKRPRGRPRKNPLPTQETAMQPGLFDSVSPLPRESEEEGIFIPGDKADLWADVVRQYGDGPLKQWLDRATYMGTRNGRFYIKFEYGSDANEFVAAESKENPRRLRDLMQQALGTTIPYLLYYAMGFHPGNRPEK